MDFAWVVDALRRGLKVTREKEWAGVKPMYIYMVQEKRLNGKRVIMFHPSVGPDFDWHPRYEDLLDADDWEEYVEPKVRQEGPFVISPLPLTGTMGMHGGKPVEEQELDEDTKQALEQLAKIMAEGIVAIFREDGIRRIIQKTCCK